MHCLLFINSPSIDTWFLSTLWLTVNNAASDMSAHIYLQGLSLWFFFNFQKQNCNITHVFKNFLQETCHFLCSAARLENAVWCSCSRVDSTLLTTPESSSVPTSHHSYAGYLTVDFHLVALSKLTHSTIWMSNSKTKLAGIKDLSSGLERWLSG